MIPELAEVDQLYLQIQDYIDTPYQHWQSLTPAEAEDFKKELRDNQEETLRIHHLAATKLHNILSQASPTNVIEVFNEGSRVLRLGIGGHMISDFNEAYIPLMISEIKIGTSRLSSLFLQTLTDQLGLQIVPLIIESLDNRITQEQAIHSVDQLKLIEAIPKVHEIAQTGPSEIASIAQEILADFNA